jgi:hypothetical protein
MASATSPSTRLANSADEGPVSRKKFSELIKYFQQTHKAIVEMTALVNRVPANQSLKFGSHTFRSSDINAYSRIFMTQLGDLNKIYGSRKKRTNKGNSKQLQSLFYVSDQLVDFYKSSKLGPADPEKPRSKLSNEIDLITDKHMATSGILTSLITNYIDANNLKAVDKDGKPTGRFMPDDRMQDAFSDCIFTLHGKDISKRKCREGTAPEKATKIKQQVSEGKQSAFDRVRDRVDKRSEENFYDEKNGLLYTTMMIFNNFYRIPSALLTDAEREALLDEENIEASNRLQERLSKITKHRNTSRARSA